MKLFIDIFDDIRCTQNFPIHNKNVQIDHHLFPCHTKERMVLLGTFKGKWHFHCCYLHTPQQYSKALFAQMKERLLQQGLLILCDQRNLKKKVATNSAINAILINLTLLYEPRSTKHFASQITNAISTVFLYHLMFQGVNWISSCQGTFWKSSITTLSMLRFIAQFDIWYASMLPSCFMWEILKSSGVANF